MYLDKNTKGKNNRNEKLRTDKFLAEKKHSETYNTSFRA